MVPGAALAAKAPSPAANAKSELRTLLKDTRRAPRSVISKRNRAKLVKIVKRARKPLKKRPCKSLKALRRYNRKLRLVKLRKIPGDVPGVGSYRSQLRADMLRTQAALLQLPRAKRCGGGKPSKVTQADARVLRSNTRQLRMRLSLPTPRFVGQQVGGHEFQQMLMDGMGETGDVGKPGLPAVQKFFGIPLGADVKLKVNGTQGYDLGGVELYPHQPDPVDAPIANAPGAPDRGVFENLPFEINKNAFKSRRKFPARASSGNVLGMMRDLRLGGVDFTGGQYQPKQNKLHVFTSIDVTVTFGGANRGTFGDSDDFNSPWNVYFNRNYAKTIVNAGAVSAHVGDITTKFPYCGEDMLVITSPELQPAATTFANARRAAGFDPRVVTTGAGAGHAGTTNTEIQAFIRGELLSKTCSKHPNYVILLGNTAHVPTFLVECAAGAGFFPDPDHPEAYCDIASDLPYSLNGVGSDLFADVMLGRIPATDLASANTVVNKIINYENTMPAPGGDDFYSHATVTGFFQQRVHCVLNEGAVGPQNCNPDIGAVNGHYEPDYPNRVDERGFTKTSDRIIRAMQFNSYEVDRLWTADPL